MTRSASPGLAVYIHWPFCRSKCPYCDFNSHVRATIDEDLWTRSLLQELDHYATETISHRVTSVFFGGGTPSLMPPETVAALLDRVDEHWSLAPETEVTLEANPNSAEAERFAAFRQAGINRLSLGVQALRDEDLKFLGRAHDAAEALAALDMAARTFERFSCDLIYTRPGQALETWREELETVLQRDPEHLSVYQLTIEEGTAFHAAARRGELELPPAELSADLFEATQEILEAAGRPAYEISNHAQAPAPNAATTSSTGPMATTSASGPGAHGRLTSGLRQASPLRQHRAPEAWLELVAKARPWHERRAKRSAARCGLPN